MIKRLIGKLKTLRLYFVISRFLDWLLIKLIRRRWKKLYKHVQNNQIGKVDTISNIRLNHRFNVV